MFRRLADKVGGAQDAWKATNRRDNPDSERLPIGELSQTALAEGFARKWVGNLAYDRTAGEWLEWDFHGWEITHTVELHIHSYVERHIPKMESPAKQQEVNNRWLNQGNYHAIAEYARTIRGQMGLLSFTPDEGIRTCYLSEQRLAEMTPDGVLADLDREFNNAAQHNEVPSLVVWDTMGRWLTGHGKDFNAYGDMSSATLPLLKLIADMGQFDTATLIAHHGNKSGKAGAQGALGSQALAGSFDNVINLSLVHGQPLNGPRYITVQGRNDTNDTFRSGALVKLFLPEGDLRLVDAVDVDDVDQRVLEAVQAGFDTRAKVVATTGESEKVCLDSLNRLKKKGDILRLGQGKTTRYVDSADSFVPLRNE